MFSGLLDGGGIGFGGGIGWGGGLLWFIRGGSCFGGGGISRFFSCCFEGEGELWGVLVLVLGRVVCVGFFYVWSGVFEEVGRCIFLLWGF